MRLIQISKKFSTLNTKETKNLKTNFSNIDRKNINFDNSFNSMSFILKKIDDSEIKAFKKQLYFYYLSTFIDKINSKNKNIIFNELGEIIKFSFPCLENVQSAYKISEANGFAQENQINKKLLYTKLTNLSVLEYCVMKANNVPRSGIRKILNGYEGIPDYLMKNVEIKPIGSLDPENTNSKSDKVNLDNFKSINNNNINNNNNFDSGNHNYKNDNQSSNYNNNNLNYKNTFQYNDNSSSELNFNSESNNKSILTVEEVVQLKAKFSEFPISKLNQSFLISKEKLEENLRLLKSIFERCSDKIEILYIAKFILGEGYSFYFLLEILKKIKTSYSQDITDDLYHYLEKNIFDFKIEFKTKNNLYNYLFKNEDLNLEIGNQFDFCIYKSGVNLNDLLYNYGRNYTKDLLMEIKFKGKRSQIHFDGERVKAFTDKVNEKDEDILNKFCLKLENEIKNFNKNNSDEKIHDFILDGNLVSYCNETKKILDFENLDKEVKSNLDEDYTNGSYNRSGDTINEEEIGEKSNLNNWGEIDDEEIFYNDLNADMEHLVNNKNNTSNKVGKNPPLENEGGFSVMNDDYIIYDSNIDFVNIPSDNNNNNNSDNNRREEIQVNEIEFANRINENKSHTNNQFTQDDVKDNNLNGINNNKNTYNNINEINNDDNSISNNEENKNNAGNSESSNEKPFSEQKVFYRFLAFDILHVNNHDLYKLPLEKRKVLLYKFFSSAIYDIAVVMGKTINLSAGGITRNEVINYYNTAREIGCDELTFKFMGYYTKYNFGNKNWIKLNSTTQKKTRKLNLIPIGAFKSKAKPKEIESQPNNPLSNSINNPINNNINNSTLYNSNNQQLTKKSIFSSFLLSIYDDVNNKFITLCLLDDAANNIPLEISENLSKNLITFYPKNYDIPIYIKPDFLFKPLEIWEVEFEEIVDSDLFLTNNDLDYSSLFKINTDDNNQQNNFEEKSLKDVSFFVGKTIKSARFLGKKQNLDINEVTTLNAFKDIYAEYFKDDLIN